MSVLLYFISLMELFISISLVTLMLMMRDVLSENPSSRSLKIKKYIGYIIVAVIFTAVVDTSYATYRYFYPVTPFDIISSPNSANKTIEKEIDKCATTIK